MSNPISEGIKRLRAQHKLTQTKLAKLADIPRATLANMESPEAALNAGDKDLVGGLGSLSGEVDVPDAAPPADE